jgi:hypothetical protein
MVDGGEGRYLDRLSEVTIIITVTAEPNLTLFYSLLSCHYINYINYIPYFPKGRYLSERP